MCVHCADMLTCRHCRTSLEVLTTSVFSTASDVWSYGVCVWEIFSLAMVPWKGLTPAQIIESLELGKRLDCPTRCPVNLFALMEKCWNGCPESRPTFLQICQELEMVSLMVCRSQVAQPLQLFLFTVLLIYYCFLPQVAGPVPVNIATF